MVFAKSLKIFNDNDNFSSFEYLSSFFITLILKYVVDLLTPNSLTILKNLSESLYFLKTRPCLYKTVSILFFCVLMIVYSLTIGIASSEFFYLIYFSIQFVILVFVPVWQKSQNFIFHLVFTFSFLFLFVFIYNL